ncbi:MAG: DUF4177 domain-containing protein [Jhaorihella sp.]
MPAYEYKVVPAPTKGQKAKGVKTPEGRFAHTLEAELNRLGAQGWEYCRAELLPSEERAGLTGSAVHWRNVLVFRRALEAAEAPADPPLAIPEGTGTPERAEPPAPGVVVPLSGGAGRMLKDNGVEEVSDVSGMTDALKSRAARQGMVDDTPNTRENKPPADTAD